MHLSYVLAVLAVDAVVAQPAHNHMHKHRRGLGDFLKKRVDFNNPDVYSGVNWSTMDWNNILGGKGSATAPAASSTSAASNGGAEQKQAVPPASQPASAPAAATSAAASSAPSTSSSSSSGGGSGQCVDISQVWTKGDTSMDCSGTGCYTATKVGPGGAWTDADTSASSKMKRATVEQDSYVGNTGSPYGRNMVPLSDCNNKNHAYSIQFTNSYPDKRDMSVALWNKVGNNNGQTSQSGATNDAFFLVDLPAGKSAAFAFEPNSQIAFSELSSTCKRGGPAGDIMCAWGEANLGPLGQGATNSWDVSLMVNMQDPQSVPGELTISSDNGGTSSREACGFTNGGQQSAGEGTGKTCNPNSFGPTHLHAQFGV